MSFYCHICKSIIAKYELDLGDTVSVMAGETMKCKTCGVVNLNNQRIYICDDCAKKIAKELIER